MKLILVLALTLALATSLAAQADRFSEFQSARIRQNALPIFPEHLVPRFPNGANVRVLISVSREGKLGEYLVVSYTAREFADAAVAALKQWEFEPARLRGEAVGVCIELRFSFEVKGCVISVGPMDTFGSAFTSLHQRDEYGPCTLRDLDRIPVPLSAGAPAYPKDLARQAGAGEVTVEFYIDERGNVRLPFAVGRPPLALAELAITALREWKFEPPTRRGVPTLVHARQVFRFNPDAATTK